MCLFIESIHVKNGKAALMPYHQQRYEACSAYHFENPQTIELNRLLNEAPKDNLEYKLRIIYSDAIVSFEYIPYKRRKIEKLRIVRCNDIDYSWKYERRFELNELKKGIEINEDIIIIKEGKVTDSSFSNLVFEKDNKYFTPETPLLKGTQRSFLIKNNTIKPVIIRETDIPKYDNIYLINALNTLNKNIPIPIHAVNK